MDVNSCAKIGIRSKVGFNNIKRIQIANVIGNNEENIVKNFIFEDKLIIREKIHELSKILIKYCV
jgi:hypothetical protein